MFYLHCFVENITIYFGNGLDSAFNVLVGVFFFICYLLDFSIQILIMAQNENVFPYFFIWPNMA